MPPFKFRSKLTRPEGVGTWTFAEIPKEISTKAGLRSHQRVRGTVDAVPFASSLMPRGGGRLFVVVNSEVREKIRKTSGMPVDFVLALDLAPVSIEVPSALRRALSADPTAGQAFEGLAPSHRKAFSQWVEGAKREETRARRISKAIQMLRKGEKLN